VKTNGSHRSPSLLLLLPRSVSFMFRPILKLLGCSVLVIGVLLTISGCVSSRNSNGDISRSIRPCGILPASGKQGNRTVSGYYADAASGANSFTAGTGPGYRDYYLTIDPENEGAIPDLLNSLIVAQPRPGARQVSSPAPLNNQFGLRSPARQVPPAALTHAEREVDECL
jgi:hypothetical protein